jgi:hypothetical protein
MYYGSGTAIFCNQILLLVAKSRSLCRDPWRASLKRCCVHVQYLTLSDSFPYFGMPHGATEYRWRGEMAEDLSFHAFSGPTAATSKNRSLSNSLSSSLNTSYWQLAMDQRRKTKQETINSNQIKDANSVTTSHQILPIPMLTLGVSDGLMRRGDLYMRNF